MCNLPTVTTLHFEVTQLFSTDAPNGVRRILFQTFNQLNSLITVTIKYGII